MPRTTHFRLGPLLNSADLDHALRQHLANLAGPAVTSVTCHNLPHPYLRPAGLSLTAYDLAYAVADLPFAPTTPPGAYHLALGGPQAFTTETLKLAFGLEFAASETLCHLAPGAALDLEFELACGRGIQPSQPPEQPNQVTLPARFTPLLEYHSVVTDDGLAVSITCDGWAEPGELLESALRQLDLDLPVTAARVAAPPVAPPARTIVAPAAGRVERIDAAAIVIAGQVIDLPAFDLDPDGYATGWRLSVQVGSHVEQGEAIATLPAVTARAPRRRLLESRDHPRAVPARELAGEHPPLDRFGVVKPGSLLPPSGILLARRLDDRDVSLRAPSGGAWTVVTVDADPPDYTIELWCDSQLSGEPNRATLPA